MTTIHFVDVVGVVVGIVVYVVGLGCCCLWSLIIIIYIVVFF